MSIRQAVLDFSHVLDTLIEDTFNECTRLTHDSVLNASEITGTQGVPYDTGVAKNSIIAEKFGKLRWRITATGRGKNDKTGEIEDAGYIIHIEENIRGVVFHEGGPHFFSKTIAGLDKIFAKAVETVAA